MLMIETVKQNTEHGHAHIGTSDCKSSYFGHALKQMFKGVLSTIGSSPNTPLLILEPVVINVTFKH